MNALSLGLATLFVLGAAGLLQAALRRGQQGQPLPAFGAFALSAVFGFGAAGLESEAASWLGLRGPGAPDPLSAVAFAWGLVGPLRQGLQVAALRPLLRAKVWRAPIDGAVYPATVALGFSAARGAWLLATAPSGAALGRGLLGLALHPMLAMAWGFALARSRRRRMAGPRFNLAWTATAAATAWVDPSLYDPTRPLPWRNVLLVLAFAGIVAALALRALRQPRLAPSEEDLHLPDLAPSLALMRETLRKAERPVLLGWVAFGTLVTLGSVGLGLGLAAWLGTGQGLDYASLEAEALTARTLRPFIVLLFCGLGPFPLAGWLIAKAAASRTVLEPALGILAALALLLASFGGTSPVAVVAALVLAPLALALGCTGAWFALPRH